MPNGHLEKREDNGQHDINEGQRRINGQFSIVDMMLIETIKLLRLEMAKLPRLAKTGEFDKIDALLKKAYFASGNVSLITPPGCEPQYRPDPKWTVT